MPNPYIDDPTKRPPTDEERQEFIRHCILNKGWMVRAFTHPKTRAAVGRHAVKSGTTQPIKQRPPKPKTEESIPVSYYIEVPGFGALEFKD